MTPMPPQQPAAPRAVDRDAFERLRRRLDRVVAQRPHHAASRDLLLQPAELLALLDDEVEAVLADDPAAADRTRLLLAAASSFEVDLSVADDLAASPAPAQLEPQPSGLLHMGALVTVGLAAIRAGEAIGHAEHFLATVQGLSLFAGAAEAIVRLGNDGPTDAALAAMMPSLAQRERSDDSAARRAALTSLVYDPRERGRWRCINRLFGKQGLRLDVKTDWGGGTAIGIEALEPDDAPPGALLDLVGNFPSKQPQGTQVVFAWRAPDGRLALGVAKVEAWRRDRVRVAVPAGAHAGHVGFALAETLARTNQTRQRLRDRWQKYPDPCLGAEPVPVARIALFDELVVPPRTATNGFRGGEPVVLRATLAAPVVPPGGRFELEWDTAGADAVEIQSGDTTRTFGPHGPSPWPAPAVDGDVRFVLTPQRLDRKVDPPAVVAAGSPTTLSGAVRSRTRIGAVTVTQHGDAALFRGVDTDVEVACVPRSAKPAVSLTARAADAGDDRGADEAVPQTDRTAGAVRFRVPGRLAATGLVLSAMLRDGGDDAAPPTDVRVVGPLVFLDRTARELIVVRPLQLAPKDGPEQLDEPLPQQVDEARASERIAGAASLVGIAAAVRELPCAADDLAVLPGPIEHADDPRATTVLAALSRAAATSPGLEHATWLALVPGERAWFRAAPAEAAACVAVCTLGGLPALFRARGADGLGGAPGARAPRLRLLGRIERSGDAVFTAARAEVRARGPGADGDTPFVLVGVDGAGRELELGAVRGLTASWPLPFEALLPLPPEVERIELRRAAAHVGARTTAAGGLALLTRSRVLAVLLRPPGAPSLLDVERTTQAASGAAPPAPDAPLEERVRWRFAHGSGRSVAFTLEMRVPAPEPTPPDGPVVLAAGAPPATLAAAPSPARWTPLARLHACPTDARLPLQRLRLDTALPGALRLVADDGWHAAVVELDGDAPANEPVVARALGGGRFVADVPAGWSVRWRLQDRDLGTRLAVQLPPASTGELLLIATAPVGAPPRTAIDVRRLDDVGEADR